MRKLRLFVHHQFPYAAYHVISRVVNRDLVFGEEEKRKLVSLMRRYERFCGMRVLTYCVMGNHFHMLVQVEQKPEGADQMTDADLVNRVRQGHGKAAARALEMELASMVSDGRTHQHATTRARYLKRMWNLSAFVQSVKQRFSTWFNKHHGRKGTLWEERYKSVIAMGPEAVASVAAYIDLNPVRAELVEDPAEYEFSGYGEAMSARSGAKFAKQRLREALCDREGSLLVSAEAKRNYLEWYRSWIYNRGVKRGVKADGQSAKKGFDAAEVAKVVAQEGRIPAAEQLAKRVRHFSDGLVVGTKDLLEDVFRSQRDYFGEKRTTGSRKMRWGAWGSLRAMRDLQVEREADQKLIRSD
jgi:putative transposase